MLIERSRASGGTMKIFFFLGVLLLVLGSEVPKDRRNSHPGYEDPIYTRSSSLLNTAREVTLVTGAVLDFTQFYASQQEDDHWGFLLEAVELNDLGRFLRLLSMEPSRRILASTGLLVACILHGRSTMALAVIEDPRRVQFDDSDLDLIMDACCKGLSPVVEALLKDGRINPSAQGNIATMMAVKYGRMKCLDLLLHDPRVNIDDGYGFLLEKCLKGPGGANMFMALLAWTKMSTPQDAFELACRFGNEQAINSICKSYGIIIGAAQSNLLISLLRTGKARIIPLLIASRPQDCRRLVRDPIGLVQAFLRNATISGKMLAALLREAVKVGAEGVVDVVLQDPRALKALELIEPGYKKFCLDRVSSQLFQF